MSPGNIWTWKIAHPRFCLILPLAAVIWSLSIGHRANAYGERLFLTERGGAAGVQQDLREAAEIRVIAVGDIMIGTDWPAPNLDPRVRLQGDPKEIYGREIADILTRGDVVFGNFEGTVHTLDRGAKVCTNPKVCFVFRSPPWYAEYLGRAGFNMMSNANNHARDFGLAGQLGTVTHLRAAGIAVSAADSDGLRIGYRTLPNGLRVALAAFGYGPGLLRAQNNDTLRRALAEARQTADVIIVSCHLGAEGAAYEHLTGGPETFLGEDRGDPAAFAHAAIDAGASLVLCHGPHVPRAVEVYRGRLIAYSLGNFWTYGAFNLSGPAGLAPIIDVTLDHQGRLKAARIHAARQTRPGGPQYDPEGGAIQRIAQLTAQDVAGSGTAVAADGEITWPDKGAR